MQEPIQASRQRIDQACIRTLIPHSGAMCLLEEVLAWDAASIRCAARSHRDAGNPLRRGGLLRSICGVEYAAQAIALHGALLQEWHERTRRERPRAGYLVSLREVLCRTARLDQGSGDLVVHAERLLGDDQQALYRFAVHSDALTLLSGRAMVLLEQSRSG